MIWTRSMSPKAAICTPDIWQRFAPHQSFTKIRFVISILLIVVRVTFFQTTFCWRFGLRSSLFSSLFESILPPFFAKKNFFIKNDASSDYFFFNLIKSLKHLSRDVFCQLIMNFNVIIIESSTCTNNRWQQPI